MTELCHQSTTCPASYAAVPHIIEAILAAPDRTPWMGLLLVVSIELSRQGIDGPGLPVPTPLSLPYHRAIDRLPEVVSRIAQHPMDEHMACCAAAALLVKGQAALAEILLFLEPEAMAQFNEWRAENI